MKTFIRLLMIIFCVIGYLEITKNQSEIISNQEQLLQNDSTMINHYLRQDSLYRDHLSRCSFISSDEMRIGYDGYVYVDANRIK